MGFCEVFFGVAAGLIVGLLVHLLVTWYINFNRERNAVKYFKYEIDVNVKKINSFIKELENYKIKVLADSLDSYYGYFYLGEIIPTTINQFFLSGLIYKKFNYEEIEELQKFIKDFSLNTEQYINGQVKNNIQDFNNKIPGVKQRAERQIKFWEYKFNDHIKKINVIKDKL